MDVSRAQQTTPSFPISYLGVGSPTFSAGVATLAMDHHLDVVVRVLTTIHLRPLQQKLPQPWARAVEILPLQVGRPILCFSIIISF